MVRLPSLVLVVLLPLLPPLAERGAAQDDPSSCPLQCAPGSEPAGGGAGCAACSPGHVSWGGTQPCVPCEAGKVPANGQGSCVLCEPGGRPRAPLNETCESCPAGRYSNILTHGACNVCGEGSVPAAQQNYCTRCVAGERPNAAQTACEACPPGYASLTSQADCHACPTGRVTNNEQSECELCPPGKESAAGQCEDCMAGRYSSHESMCEECPEGHVVSQAQAYCVRCVAGERPNADRTACELCPEGFVSGTTQSDCHACPAGRIPNGEQSQCEPCPPGCEATDGSQCRPCSPGNYSTLFGSCHACPAGHVPRVCDGRGSPSCVASSNATQETCEPLGSCDRCSAGTAPNSEGTRCEICPLGHVSQGGDHQCHACPAGKVAARDECTVCPRGSAPNRLNLAERCEPCLAGRTADPGDSSCNACPEGHHSQIAGSVCAACLGRTEPNLEQTGCVCKTDHFNASLYPSLYPSVSPGCVPCDARTLGEIADRVTCPGGLWRPGGRAHLFAVPGFWIGNWSIHEGVSKVELASDERMETKDIYVQLGFNVGTSPLIISDFVYYCSSPVVCPGFTLSSHLQHDRFDLGNVNLSTATGLNLTEMTALCEANDGAPVGQCIDGSVCADTHSGVLCGTCASPHGLRMQKLSDHRCAVCDGTNRGYVLALFVCWAMFALFLDFKARQINVHEDGAALGILTFFFQSLALFADRKGDNAVYGLARLINMDLISAVDTDEGTPQCLLDIGPTGGWLMSSVWVPVYICFCSAVVLKLQEASYTRRIADDTARAADDDVEDSTRDTNDAEDGGMRRRVWEKVKARYSAATDLNFLRLRVLYRADNAGLIDGNAGEARALLTWWRLSCIILKKKMIRKHRFRMVLEVAMFAYMGATKQAFKLIPGVTACLSINGEWYSSLDVQMACSETYSVQAISVLLLLFFTAGFPAYILWKVGGKMGDESDDAESNGVNGRPKAPRFTTMARVAYIFTAKHRGWMAYLMLRRVALVAVFQIGSMHGGTISVPGTRGGQIDWRVLAFFVVAVFVLLQAWERPFASDLDNSLEQTTLTMLLCVLYANVALTQPTWTLGPSEVAPNLVVISLAVLFVMSLWVSQRQAREQIAKVHQADFGGIVTKMTAHFDAQQVVRRQEGDMSEAALASLQRTVTTEPRGVTKTMENIWTVGRRTVRAPKILGAARNDEVPAPVLDRDITAKSRVRKGLKGLSEDDMEQIDRLKRDLGVTTTDVLRYFETFSCFDKDGSGLLDVSELKQVFDTLGGSRIRNEDIIRVMIADLGLDADASGDVSFPEFLQMMVMEKKKVDQDEEVEEAFKTFIQSAYEADLQFGFVESDADGQNQKFVEPPITPKILLYLLTREGLVDADDTASEQEQLAQVMLTVANRFAPAKNKSDDISDSVSITEADATPDSVAFTAGAALGISQAARDGISTGGVVENPIGRVKPVGDQAQAVNYATFRAMMIAIGDPSKVALDVALVNERSRLHEELNTTAETSEAPSQRKRFVTVG